MIDVSFRIVEDYELAPYVEDLRALEAGIAYPLDDDAFTIDHGEAYHPFFSRMGESRFLIVEVDGRAVGTLAGVWREVSVAGERHRAVYMGDFKLAPELRGGRIARSLAKYVLEQWWRRPELGHWRMAFGAAMRGVKGDVMRTTKGRFHVGRLLEPMGEQLLFFVDAPTLSKVSTAGEPLWPHTIADFTPDTEEMILRTDGVKDLRLVSGEGVWALAHLPRAPQRCAAGYGAYLAECAELISEQDARAGRESLATFGLDVRAVHAIDWLARHGITPEARCTLYGMHFPERGRRHIDETNYIHLSTSMI